MDVHLLTREVKDLRHPEEAVITQVASREDVLFDESVSYIRAHLSDEVSVASLATQVGANKEKLTEIFRQRLGITVAGYISELKLQTANAYLANTELQIQEIATLVGYRNAGDFTRAYKRRFAITPKEYRSTKVLPHSS